MGSGNQIIVIKLLCTGGITEPCSPLQNNHVLRVTWREWGDHGGEGMRCSPNSSGRIRECRAEQGPASAFTDNTPMTKLNKQGSWLTSSLGPRRLAVCSAAVIVITVVPTCSRSSGQALTPPQLRERSSFAGQPSGTSCYTLAVEG